MKTFTNFTNENRITQYPSTDIPDRDLLFNRIKSLGSWLYRKDGLGMMKIIDKIIQDQGWSSPLSSDDIQKFRHGLEILRKTSMTNSYINSQLSYGLPNGIENKKLVFDENGNWDYVNKLNTNHSDIADLLTELIMRGIERNYEKGMVVYDRIIKNPEDGLLSIKDYLERLIINYFIVNGDGLDEFKKFTKHSRSMSKTGEKSEKMVVDYLTSRGFKVVYSGGNGDYIDMIFGCDLIVQDSLGNYKTIQVKNKIRDWNRLSHYRVDWVAETNPIRIYNLKDRTLVRI